MPHGTVPQHHTSWRAFDRDRTVKGPFYVMDRLDGRVPDESPMVYHAAGWVAAATPQQRQQLWLSTLSSMASLHRVDVADHFGYLSETRWGINLHAHAAAERVRQWREYTVWASDNDNPPSSLMRAWDTLQAALPPRPNVLSIGWGDAKLGNVMFQGFDVVALLDWELCGIGPAEEDLMNLLAVDAVLADLFRVPRIDGFASREETIATYEHLLGREMVATNWWYVFALAKMAAEMHRILRQTRKFGGMPTDVDLEAINGALQRLQLEIETL